MNKTITTEEGLTEMQKFTLDFVNKQRGKEVNAGWLATAWDEYKNKRYRAASRDRFGLTTAAYRSLRLLAINGLITQRISKTSGGYTLEYYSQKQTS